MDTQDYTTQPPADWSKVQLTLFVDDRPVYIGVFDTMSKVTFRYDEAPHSTPESHESPAWIGLGGFVAILLVGAFLFLTRPL